MILLNPKRLGELPLDARWDTFGTWTMKEVVALGGPC